MTTANNFLDRFDSTQGKSNTSSELINYIQSNISTVFGNAGPSEYYRLAYDLGLKLLDKKFNPHINGFYYVSVEPGTWVDYKNRPGNYCDDFSSAISDFKNNCSTYITDIDIPNLTLEYDAVSGKARSINYATKTSFASDFSLNIMNDYDSYCLKYIDSQFKFISDFKKGTIEPEQSSLYISQSGDNFTDIPYFDAIWVAIFKPFTFQISCLIKILGVAPVNMPFKNVMGDRAKNEITSLNMNYKSTDMFYKLYGDNPSGDLYQEFINHINSKSKS